MLQQADSEKTSQVDVSIGTRSPDRAGRVQKFRFVPDSYLTAVGTELDIGLEVLVYLRLMLEDETEDLS